MKRINVYIPLEQFNELKKLVTSRVSFSEHIRRAIDLYLKSVENE